VIAVLGIVLAVLAAGTIGLRLWSEQGAGDDAPRIGLSVSDAWFDDLGFHRAPYDISLAQLGARVVTLRPSDDAHRIDKVLDDVDAVLLSGGFDVDPRHYGLPGSANFVDPVRDSFEFALLEAAESRGLPVLGICRGIQVMAVAYGGRLERLSDFLEISDRHGFGAGPVHEVDITPGSKLASAIGSQPLRVNSTHLRAVEDPGRLRVCARALDGTIEAIELPGDRLVLGIQWHPELLGVFDPETRDLLQHFVNAARAYREGR
jgi:putative glutamine amidotransferase